MCRGFLTLKFVFDFSALTNLRLNHRLIHDVYVNGQQGALTKQLSCFCNDSHIKVYACALYYYADAELHNLPEYVYH